MEPARGPGRSRAVAPSPPPAPTPPPPEPRPGKGHRGTGAAPRAPNSPGLRTRPGSAPPPRLSRSGGAGREGAKEEGRGGEESSAGEPDGGRGLGLGAAGSPRGGGRPGRGCAAPPAPSRRGGRAGGRPAAVPHHVGVLQASPLLLRLRSEWTAAAAAAPLTGSPGSRSCAVRGGPGAARGGSPGPGRGGGTGADVGRPAQGFPGARGPPGGGATRAGQGATYVLRAPTSSRRAWRSPAGWVAWTHTSASYALLPPSDRPGRVYTGSERHEGWPITGS